MKVNFIGEISVSIFLILILGLFAYQTKILMPKSFDMFVLLLFVILYFFYTTFLWKEKEGDERENLHKLKAGRLSFFAGNIVLGLGIVIQAINHNIDPWLIYTLVAMVVAKVASRIYSQLRN